MMQVRCQRCGWMLTLGREAIAVAVAEAQQSHEQHHVVDCPRCRRAIKVPVADLRRRLPANYPLPEITPAAADSAMSSRSRFVHAGRMISANPVSPPHQQS